MPKTTRPSWQICCPTINTHIVPSSIITVTGMQAFSSCAGCAIILVGSWGWELLLHADSMGRSGDSVDAERVGAQSGYRVWLGLECCAGTVRGGAGSAPWHLQVHVVLRQTPLWCMWLMVKRKTTLAFLYGSGCGRLAPSPEGLNSRKEIVYWACNILMENAKLCIDKAPTTACQWLLQFYITILYWELVQFSCCCS